MRIVTRAEWRARTPSGSIASTPIKSRTATCIHHDGPVPITIRTFAQACQRVRDDQNYHMGAALGWYDIGYNYLVISAAGVAGVDGLIFEGRGRDKLGAHCEGHNAPWVGIQCAIGGGQVPSAAALASIRWLHDTLATAAGHSLAKQVHSDGFNTACPDPILKAWVHAGMPITNTPAQEPDMPLTAQEITAVSQGAATETWNRFKVNGLSLSSVLARLLAQGDPAALAAAIVAAMPPAIATGTVAADPAVLREVVGDALREAFAAAGTP
jgi:hypothetical protein